MSGAGMAMKRIKWYCMQLLPLTYKTKYHSNGQAYFDVWQMWFGRVFNHTSVPITEEVYQSL